MSGLYAIKKVALAFIAILAASVSFSAFAVPYYWTDWTSWDPANGTAIGVITPSSGPQVIVHFDALTSSGAHGSFLGVTSGLWTPTSTYQSAQVDNAPEYEAIQLVGESNMTYRVTLSEAIRDPLMAVTTLGGAGDSATYVFDSPFTILSQGPTCCWGGGNTNLTQLPGNVLQGVEGAGVIQFNGTYSSFSWTVPDPEFWHAFTFGIRTTERLDPTPSTSVPAPASLALAGIALAAIGLARWLKR